MNNRLSAEKHTKVFCVTPKESFATTREDVSFFKHTYYFAFGVNIETGKHTDEKVLIFNSNYNYVMYATDITKRFFKYVEDYPIKPEQEKKLLDELYRIIKMRF